MPPRERPTTRFPGSEAPVPSTKVEMLNADKSQETDDNYDDGVETSKPAYKREEIGPRIGEEVNSRAAMSELAHQLEIEDRVPLLFPRQVMLQDRGLMHTWGPGVHLVPISIAGRTPKEMHWYLRSHRVRRAGDIVPAPTTQDE